MVHKKNLLILVLLLCVHIINAQAGNKEQLMVSLSKVSKPFRLTAGLSKGSIQVITYAGKDVMIEVEKLPGKLIKPTPNQNQNTNTSSNSNVNEHTPLQRTETKVVKGKYVIATENDNSIIIGATSLSDNLHLLIKLPQNKTSLTLSIDYEGDISVNGVNGETEINNTNGSVVLTNIAGSVIASTVTGNISTTFTSVAEQSPMAFSTLSGKVDIGFPPSFKANLKLQPEQGSLYSDYEISFDGTKPPVSKVNVPCLYKIQSSESLTGKVNGGGAEILIKSMQGDIYIRKAR